MGYDGVIFDKDGVLIDSTEDGSMEWLFRARVEAAEEIGLEDFGMDEAMKLVNAESNKEIEDFMKQEALSYDDLKRIEKGRAEEKMKRVQSGRIGLMPGIEEILNSLSGKRLAVVSNGTIRSTRFTLKVLGIIDYFDDVIAPSTEDMESFYDLRKPSPEILERVMRQMDSDNFLMVGDSSSDVEAAERAGIDSALLDIYGKKLEMEPDYRISGLGELRSVVSD